MPNLSGNNGHRPLPGESGNDDWPSFVELGYEHGRPGDSSGSLIEWVRGCRGDM